MSSRRSRSAQPRRRLSESAAKRSLYVVVEGARTETEYILHWGSLYRSTAVIIHPQKGLAPRTMIDVAVAKKREAERDQKRGRGRAYDEVWCVFDVDEHPALHEVQTKASDNGVRLAVSNPCIELWFLLHFRDQTAELDRTTAQRLSAAALGSGKSLSVDSRATLVSRHDAAMSRAKVLTARHVGNGLTADANPSSTLWKLLESIRTRGE